MVYFTFSRHKMADFTISRFGIIYFQVEAVKRGHEKHSVNITISRLKMTFVTNSHTKKENFTIETGIANHDFTSIFGRFHVLTHKNSFARTCITKNLSSPQKHKLRRLRKSLALGNAESTPQKAHLIRGGFQGKIRDFPL